MQTLALTTTPRASLKLQGKGESEALTLLVLTPGN